MIVAGSVEIQDTVVADHILSVGSRKKTDSIDRCIIRASNKRLDQTGRHHDYSDLRFSRTTEL